MARTFADVRHERYCLHAATDFERPRLGGRASDIVLHLPVLEFYASRCYYVTEFGVRDGHSTVALLAGCRGTVRSYDVERSPLLDELEGVELPCTWRFFHASSLEAQVKATDFLFLDTLHTAEQVAAELRLHGRKAGKYLGFHDTATCGEFDRSGPDPGAPGILPALREFLAAFPGEYRVAYETTANNGIMIYERVTQTGE